MSDEKIGDHANGQEFSDDKIGDHVNGQEFDNHFENELIGDRLNSVPEEELYSQVEKNPEVLFWMKSFRKAVQEKETLQSEADELNETFVAISDQADQLTAKLSNAKKRIVLLETALKDMSTVLAEVDTVGEGDNKEIVRVLKQAEELLGNNAKSRVIVLDEEARDEIIRILNENTIQGQGDITCRHGV